MQLAAIDHIYLSVSNFARSEKFYDAAMGALGFRKGTTAVGRNPLDRLLRTKS